MNSRIDQSREEAKTIFSYLNCLSKKISLIYVKIHNKNESNIQEVYILRAFLHTLNIIYIEWQSILWQQSVSMMRMQYNLLCIFFLVYDIAPYSFLFHILFVDHFALCIVKRRLIFSIAMHERNSLLQKKSFWRGDVKSQFWSWIQTEMHKLFVTRRQTNSKWLMTFRILDCDDRKFKCTQEHSNPKCMNI